MKKRYLLAIVVTVCLGLNSCATPSKKRVPLPPQNPDYSQGQQSEMFEPDIVPGQKVDGGDIFESDLGDVTKPEEPSDASVNYVSERVVEYRNKLERWKTLDSQSVGVDISQEDTEKLVSCFQDVQQLLSIYRNLEQNLLHPSLNGPSVSQSELMAVQKSDVVFLESDCGKMLAAKTEKPTCWEMREDDAGFARMESLIAEFSGNQEYDKVIQAWLQIPQEKLSKINVETKMYYADALMFQGQDDIAAQTYHEIIKQLDSPEEQPVSLLTARRKLGDLYSANGQVRGAKEQYQMLSGDYKDLGKADDWAQMQVEALDSGLVGTVEYRDYISILRSHMSYIAGRDGYETVDMSDHFLLKYPASSLKPSVEIMRSESALKADLWYSQIESEIESLVAEKNFQKAIDTINAIPQGAVTGDKLTRLENIARELEINNAIELETQRMAESQKLQSQWNNAVMLANAERYDEAIDMFAQMADSEYGPRAQMKIDELSIVAAQVDRRKAADLFIRYTRTSDVEQQKELLIESRALLKGILEKYPDSDVIDKVHSNIKRVEQEMNAIDPALISMADAQLTIPTPTFDDRAIDDVFEGQYKPGPPQLEIKGSDF